MLYEGFSLSSENLRNSRGRFSFADSHSPEPDGFSVVGGFAHATVVPADDAGGHRHRHGAEVQRNRLLRVDAQLRPRLHWKLPVNFYPFRNVKLLNISHPWEGPQNSGYCRRVVVVQKYSYALKVHNDGRYRQTDGRYSELDVSSGLTVLK